jgi:Na+/H+ antiporter NhaC
VALITTWIGAELGYIQEGLDKVSQQGFEMGSAYGILINSLSYAFYPLLTIFFMFLIIWKQKDFGPMLKAEKAARKIESKMDESAVTPLDIDEVATDKERVVNAIIPIAVLIFGTMAALFYTGSIGNPWQNDHGIWFNLSNWVGASDSYSALLWSSFSALVIAVILTVAQRIHSLGKTLEYAIEGIKIMIPAIAILALAWSLAAVTDKINTAEYLSSLLGSDFRPEFLPAITFVLAALISFATGTSWGTMAILYPLVLFTSYSISVQAGLDEGHVISIYANVVSCVLAGSVLGDHCSPISDTTILSSLASSCNHVSHVRTQLPYALTVGIVSVLLGTLPSAFGIHPLICFAGAMICIYAIVSYFGKMAEG